MKIHLPVHIIPGLQIVLDRVNSASRNVQTVSGLVDLDRFYYPLEIVNAVLRTGHQAVAKQVIHPVNVELRRDQLGESERFEITSHHRRDILR